MINVIIGTNAYKTSRHLNQLIKEFKAKHGALAIERIDCEEADLPQIIAAVSSQSLLAEDKMVVLKNLVLNKLASEAIEQITSSINETTQVIIYDQTTDKRTQYYKALKKLKSFNEYSNQDQNDLPKWLTSEAKKMEAELSIADANYLISRVGANQQLLAMELEKLAIYNAKINRETIALLTTETPQSKVFDLLDAAFAGNKQRALKLYAQQRTQRVEPQEIMGMLAWQLRLLAAIELGAASSVDKIAKDLGLSTYPLSKAKALASKMLRGKVAQLINDAALIDKKAKTSSIDLNEALKTYIFSI